MQKPNLRDRYLEHNFVVHLVKYVCAEKSRRGENITCMKKPSLFSFSPVPYLTNSPTHDFLFVGLLCPASIFSLRYCLTDVCLTQPPPLVVKQMEYPLHAASGASPGIPLSLAKWWSCCSLHPVRQGRWGSQRSMLCYQGNGSSGWRWGFPGWLSSQGPEGEF